MQPLNPTFFGVDSFTWEWHNWIVYVAFLVVLAIALYILYDSQAKNKEAMVWRVLTILGLLLILPSLILAVDGRLSSTPLAARFTEWIKYLPFVGVVGGVLGVVALIGYIGWAKERYVSPPIPYPTPGPIIPQPTPAPQPPVLPDTKVASSGPQQDFMPSPAPAKTEILHRPPPQMAWLVVRSGIRAGKEFRLGEITNIGRDAMHNDIAIDDPAVSGQHARIKLEDGKFVLYDLASTNGTTVNGEKVLRHVLNHGDQVVMGETQFTFMQIANT